MAPCILRPELVALMGQNQIGNVDGAVVLENDGAVALQRCRSLPRRDLQMGFRPHDQHGSHGRAAAAPAASPGPDCSTPITGSIQAKWIAAVFMTRCCRLLMAGPCAFIGSSNAAHHAAV